MTQDNSSAQLVDDLRAALNWCVSNSGECLGDHPDRLKRFDALIDQTFSIALTRPQPSTSSVEAVARALAADIMAAMRRARLPKEYADEAHDEFEALTLVPMLLAALPSPEREWQPIESAPKDGTWIIGLSKLGDVVPMRWGVSWHDQHWANGCVIYEPSLWMPLPPPSTQDTGEGKC